MHLLVSLFFSLFGVTIEWCDVCGRSVLNNKRRYWQAPDYLWQYVTGSDNGLVLCLFCWKELLEIKVLEYVIAQDMHNKSVTQSYGTRLH